MHRLMKSSYRYSDVKILLKDLTGKIQPMATKDRERAIQSGINYCEMLPKESRPTEKYMELYEQSMERNKRGVAIALMKLAESIVASRAGSEAGRDGKVVLIDLARAGLPIGVLLTRYIRKKYGLKVSHYSISIIRGVGIDENAMDYIVELEGIDRVKNFIFVDGWTGKGAILRQLEHAVAQLKMNNPGKWEDLSPELAVLADPANICNIFGTKQDFLLPTSCLNSTISGLISRTIFRDDLVDTAAGDFHGAVYMEEFEDIDLTNKFIEEIEKEIKDIEASGYEEQDKYCIKGESSLDVVNNIARIYGVQDINKIKPGIGETTRVLLRRVPWKVLLGVPEDTPDVQHIINLCEEKHVPYEQANLGNYTACGIIKDLSADA